MYFKLFSHATMWIHLFNLNPSAELVYFKYCEELDD